MIGDEPPDLPPDRGSVDDAFQDVLWPPRVVDNQDTRCLCDIQVWDSASRVRFVEGIPSLAADVPADDPMLEGDQPGEPGGVPIPGSMPPDEQRPSHCVEERITIEKRLQRLLLGSLTGCLKEGILRCMVDLAGCYMGRLVGVYDLLRNWCRSLSEGSRRRL